MSQNSLNDYGPGLVPGIAGQKYDLRPDVVTSHAAEGAVPFGYGVKRGTDLDKQCEAIDGSSDVFLGVALATHTQENVYNNGVLGGTVEYGDTDTVSVLRKGAVWVVVTEAVVAGDVAYVDAGGSDAGNFCKTSSQNVATGGRFLTSADSGDLAVLELL